MSTNTFILALCLCAFNFAAPTSEAEKLQPGLVVRLFLAGLNYAAEEGVKKLASQIKGSRDFIPDSSVGSGTTIRNIRVTDFVITQTNVSISPGNGIYWQVESARISLNGILDYTDTPTSVPYNAARGTLDISAEGIHSTIKTTLGVTSGGLPSVILLNCSTSVDKVAISYNKSISSGAREAMEDTFRKKISDAVCQTAAGIITKNAAAELETMRLNETVQNNFTVDYRLVDTPGLYDDFVETGHSGEFRLTDELFGPSFLPSELGLPKTAQSMVTFYVSEYVINTLAEAMFKIKLFDALVTKNDPPPTLATICNATCFGTAFPQVSRQYPNVSAALVLRATAPPILAIRNDSANLKAKLEMTFVLEPGYGRDVVTVTLLLTGSSTVTASVDRNKLVGKLPNITLSVVNITRNATSSHFRHILMPDDDNLNRLLEIIGNLVVLPALNKVAAVGFRLPTLDGVNFLNPKLTTISSAFAISADFAYKPEAFKSAK